MKPAREEPARPVRLSRRRFLAVAGAAGAATTLRAFPAIVRPAPRTRSVIVLGIDGMDPTLLRRFVGEGRMPNCRRLMEAGGFSPLGTSDPPQSPVAWSNFISGTNPGGHGIYDFLARDPATMQPRFSLARVAPAASRLRLGRHILPLAGPTVENLRRGPTFWVELEKRGIDCTVLRIPANFPPTPTRARTLSGLGTPDLLGTYGLFTLYSADPDEETHDVPGGRIEQVQMTEHRAECILRGPADPLDAMGRRTSVPFTVRVDPSNPVARLTVQGRELLLNEGEWSDWVAVRFGDVPWLAEAPGICRFLLMGVHPHLALYASAVNIDPAAPALPISTPHGYAAELAGALGRFHTQGIAEDTKALSAGVFDDDDYRRQSLQVHEEAMRLFEHEFARFERGFFFSYFSALDLNSHVFWRTLDRDHPLFLPALAERHGDYLPWLYGQMDRAVGKAMERVDERTLLLVMSDHGFGSFRRQFNLNSWLMDNGYAAAIEDASRGKATLFADADWRRTRAYGLGLNGLYLNRRGRETNGIVAPGDESERLAGELANALAAVRDPKTGERVVSRVCRPKDLYSGPHVGLAPDLLVCYAPNYRASWDTVLGGYPREHLLDNTDPWSGDHALDSAFMAGVLLSSQPLWARNPTLSDLAPTILGQFGLPPMEGMTGRPII